MLVKTGSKYPKNIAEVCLTSPPPEPVKTGVFHDARIVKRNAAGVSDYCLKMIAIHRYS